MDSHDFDNLEKGFRFLLWGASAGFVALAIVATWTAVEALRWLMGYL